MPQTPSLPQPSYTLQAFQAEYKLPLVQAVSWYDRFGPDKETLDNLMKSALVKRAKNTH